MDPPSLPAAAAAENPGSAQPTPAKRKRSLPGTPDPDAEVVALSPETLLSSSTFACEVCGKEFRRSQNLRIHRRGHNLPWDLAAGARAAAAAEAEEAARKRVYVCPEETCVHHDPARALGDITGIKKHYGRKHGERKWKCEWCPKSYAVRADWKAHARVCGSRRYECDCGTLYARKDSFVIHRAACGAMAEEVGLASSPGAAARTNTVNSELLFPSLWGHVPEPEEGEEEQAPATARARESWLRRKPTKPAVKKRRTGCAEAARR